MIANYHTHTPRCNHATGSEREFIEKAILTFHEVYASSAAELVTEILQYAETHVELTSLEAEGLYAGIMTDTKNFTFKTGVRTFEAAAFLRKKGVDILKVKKWFQSDLRNYNEIADIVKNAEIVNETINETSPSSHSSNIGMQLLTSGPTSQWSSIALVFLKAISNAKRSILIQTPKRFT